MSKLVFRVFALFLFLAQVWGAVQKITIYEKLDQQGESYTFMSKNSNLTDCQKSFLRKTNSYCVTGYWNYYDLPDFEYRATNFEIKNRMEKCGNRNFKEFESARFMGPEDFDTPAISFFEGNSRYIHGGREYILTGPAANNIPFSPHSAFSFGNSSWTLFTGKQFDGNSTCFAPNGYNDVYTGSTAWNSDFVVQSVAKGCDEEVANNIKLFKNNLKI